MRQKASSPSSEAAVPRRRDPLSPILEDTVRELAGLLGRGSPVAVAVDPSLEGILAATGLGYLAHVDARRLRLVARGAAQPRIGEAYLEAPSPSEEGMVELATRVLGGFRQRCGATCARRLVLAAATDDAGAAEAIHRYVRLGFSRGTALLDLVADGRCLELNRLARSTLSECEHTRQFVRFSHLSDGSWMARFEPTANTIPLTAQHFVRRMPTERFFIVDPVHHVAAFHQWGARRADLLTVRGALLDGLLDRGRQVAGDEELARMLWRNFYGAVALPGRDASQRGYDLRVGLMPKRLWKNLTELADA